ncbi:alpha/beta fold hydrolase [Nonomuraea typhae]|uniref:alpha/beta fold hydrolase n=1 Tax=Nonomuraea typhae TaxID=2603600 RepID=UPI0012F9F985|nr:alpha/beta hydrolase [Nonomuraea typhae]
MEVNGVSLWVEDFGDPADPAILLIHGAGESLLAWDDAFVRRLVAGGRRVIRYDSRDAGRSTTYPAGSPGYTLRDLVADAVGVLDALGVRTAHLVGMSQGSAVAQLVALDHPERTASLTLASSSPGGPGHENPDLPGMSPALQDFFTEEAPAPDWTDRDAVIAYLVASERPFAAASRPFAEEVRRANAGRVVDRAADIAAQLSNPFLIDPGQPWRHRLGRIAVPALVFHGAEDPLFPVEHGQALAAEIPGARFVAMPATGHEVFPEAQWDLVVPALLAHTAA